MGTKLLLADDSITIQKVIGIILANEDVELTVVDNGISALEKARQVVPDIMLVDALMPGRNGYEVCEEVRRDPRLKHVPLLLLTGAFEPFDEEKAKLCGADDYISKPFESQQLIEKIRKVMEAARMRPAPAAAAAPAAAVVAEVTPEPAPAVAEAFAAPALTPAEFAVFQEAPAAGGPLEAEGFAFAEEEIVEGTPEDDLWGAVELEEEAEGEEFVFGEVVEEEGEAFAFAEAEEVSEFAFAEEPQRAEPPSVAAEPADIEFGAFAEPPLMTEDLEGVPDTLEPPAEAFAFIEPSVSHAPVGEQVFAPEEEYMPAPAPLAQTATAAPAPQAPAASLSEEQLAAIVARISKELIEKIAWEVVPDLAETIIKEEIRRIKEGQ